MDYSTPGFPVLHHLPEFAQTHVCWVGDAIQPSHPLSFPSIFPSIRGSSHQVVKVLKLQHQSLQWNIQGWSPFWLTGLISVQSKRLSRVFSSATIRKHKFFGAQPSLWCLSHPYMTTGKTMALTIRIFVSNVCFLFLIHGLVCQSFSSKEQVSFNFVAAVTVYRDFGAQENKICHGFHFFPFYFPWSDGTECHDLSSLSAEF